MIRCFWFISMLVINLACHRKLSLSSDNTMSAFSAQEPLIPLVSIPSDSLKTYNTTVEAYGKYFSGVTYVKNIHDSTLRVLFTTHTGMKLFDLELAHNTCTTKYVIEQMNNAIVLKLLCHDFGLLTGGLNNAIAPHQVFEKEGKERIVLVKGEKDLYYYLTDLGAVTKIVETVADKKKIQTVFSKQTEDSSLAVKHYNFNFDLHFKNAK
jgi:hypothetical protein